MIQHFLLKLEHYGNRIPHPSLLFFWLCLAIIVVSAIAAWLAPAVTHPIDQQVIHIRNLCSADGLRFILGSMVGNFTGFAPLGTVLVAMLGIGIAEQSGLLAHLLQRIVRKSGHRTMTFMVALAGILSSLVADAGYVVLIPLSALLFIASGRPALAGIATAFAGVSAGYTANLLLTPLDAILSGISTSAAQITQPDYTISASANWYFAILSTGLLALLITVITHKKHWPATNNPTINKTCDSSHHSLRAVAVFTLLYLAALLLLSLPTTAPLRNPQTGLLINSPLSQNLVILISLYFALAGMLYGFANRTLLNASQVIEAMEDTMRSMAPYLVMMFFAAQFIAFFQWSNLGLLLAINGAAWLQSLSINHYLLLCLFIATSGFINLFIGSASAKWVLIAPVFVPMFMLLGISPEITQQAYRIGDSSTNIISPLMPYFALVLGFVQQHDKQAGVGTLVATMLPYAVMISLVWSLVFIGYLLAGLPLGF